MESAAEVHHRDDLPAQVDDAHDYLRPPRQMGELDRADYPAHRGQANTVELPVEAEDDAGTDSRDSCRRGHPTAPPVPVSTRGHPAASTVHAQD